MLYSNKAWHWEKFNILNGYSWIIPFLKDKGFDTQTADIHTPQSTKQLVLYVPLCWRETRMSVHTSVHSPMLSQYVTTFSQTETYRCNLFFPRNSFFHQKAHWATKWQPQESELWISSGVRTNPISRNDWPQHIMTALGGGGQWSVTDEVGLQVNWGSRCWVHVILLQSA